MNNFALYLVEVIKVAFLFVVAIFLIHLITEYIRTLWIRHQMKKNFKKVNKAIDEQIDKAIEKMLSTNQEVNEDELKESISETLKERGIENVNIDNIKIIGLEKNKKSE